MKLNMKIIALLSILLLLSLSAVTAADDNQTITQSEDNDDIIEVSQTQTFADLQGEIKNLSTGDTLTLESDYKYNSGFDVNGITVNKEITIDGNGKTLDAKKKGRIFRITADNVVVKNLTFNRGHASNYGAAILCTGENLTLIDCYFKNNVVDEGIGGAIYVLNNNVNVTNCQFYKNSAQSSGGAIRVDGNYTTITNSTFKTNKAYEKLGGGIYITGNNNTILNNEFSGNVALYSGGAILIYGSDTIISNNTFKSNKANKKLGGGMYIQGNNTNITDNNFTQNFAQYSGGAYRIEGYNIIITRNNYTYNNATEFLGGAVCALGDDIIVSNDYYAHNFAGRDGGGLDLEGIIVDTDGYRNQAINNTFIENRVAQYGGGISMNCRYGVVANNTFLNNYAGKLGGGLRVNGAHKDSGTIINNTFIDCYSAVSGGAMYVSGNDTTVTKNLIKSCTAAGIAGGGINLHGNRNTASYNTITLTKSKTSGGAIYCEGHYANIHHNTISKAKSGTSGAGIYLTGQNAKVTSNKISYCEAGTIAGAVHFKTKNGLLKNNRFTKNSAKESGGACYIEGKSIKVQNNTFISNKASSKNIAGAIRHVGNKAVITGNTFKKNTAKYGKSIFGSGNNKKLSENKYVGSSQKAQVTWNKLVEKTTIKIPVQYIEFNNPKRQVHVTLLDSANDPIANKIVKVVVDGKYSYNLKTNKKGVATLNLKSKTISTHKIQAKFAGSSVYKSSSRTSTYHITKVATKLNAPTKTFNKTADSKKVTVTLKKTRTGSVLKSKKVSLKVDGKTYSGKTNSKGKVSFNVKLTEEKTYTYQVKFAGDSTYSSTSKKGKITIV